MSRSSVNAGDEDNLSTKPHLKHNCGGITDFPFKQIRKQPDYNGTIVSNDKND